ncbi:MAG: 16S rRNA (cytidine(1402)-2'-O)-methyltransferase [Verrucomicrobiota bacterium]|nr:16S rRNA (cytidine(1402)-2'-O)-methyltransferase [Verrucomicrobiota bacterium]
MDDSHTAPGANSSPGADGVSRPETLPAGLYLVGTPIGNREDITLRALRILRSATHILAEDTRHTQILLDTYGIRTPMISYHKFNERTRTGDILHRIRAGESLALVTDAGMPGISDPGAIAARAVREAGMHVTAIPGPSALTMAIALCGCPHAHGFLFEGFLDHKTAARRKKLRELAACSHPVVFYESTHRLLKLLDEVEEELGPERLLFIARELTKKFEETLHGTPTDLRTHYQTHSLKGEFVVVLFPRSRREQKNATTGSASWAPMSSGNT